MKRDVFIEYILWKVDWEPCNEWCFCQRIWCLCVWFMSMFSI